MVPCHKTIRIKWQVSVNESEQVEVARVIAPENWAEVRGSGAAVQVIVDDPIDDYATVLWVAELGTVFQCTGLRVAFRTASKAVTARSLREVRIQIDVARAAMDAGGSAFRSPAGRDEKAGRRVLGPDSAEPLEAFEGLASLTKVERKRPLRTRLDDQFYVEVAELYREAVHRGVPIWKHIALQIDRAEGFPAESTVRQWIGVAAEKGFLPPTTRGKKRRLGSQTGPKEVLKARNREGDDSG